MADLKHDYQIKDQMLTSLLELKSNNAAYISAESFGNYYNLPIPRCTALLKEILEDKHCAIYKTSPHDSRMPEKTSYQINALGESFLIDKGGYKKRHTKKKIEIILKVAAGLLIPLALLAATVATCSRT